MTDPLDFATWEQTPDSDTPPVDRPTEWNGKPIPENALWEDDGVTPKLTPTGRIRRSGRTRKHKSTTTVKAADLAQVRDDLTTLGGFLIVSSSTMLPTVSLVLAERAEVTADAIVQVAKNRPKTLAAIQRAAQVGPAMQIAQTGAMIVVAVALDTGRTTVANPFAQVTGVSQLHLRVRPDAMVPRTPGPQPPHMSDVGSAPPFIVKEKPGDISDPEHARYAFAAQAGPGDNGVPPNYQFTPQTGGPFGAPFPP